MQKSGRVPIMNRSREANQPGFRLDAGANACLVAS